ncbi:MAG: dienelactone hydrolase family protein [Janthinobacterium lividum]
MHTGARRLPSMLCSSAAEVDPASVAAIGFCFGSTMALELARSGATVGFYSGVVHSFTSQNTGQ